MISGNVTLVSREIKNAVVKIRGRVVYINFKAISMDDYQVILDMQFMQKAKLKPTTFFSFLCLIYESPYVITNILRELRGVKNRKVVAQ